MAKLSEALIVGAGPVGLFGALALLERGVEVNVLASGRPRLPRSYACGLHPATLMRFERLGILPALQEQAHRVDRLVLRRAGASPEACSFGGARDGAGYVLTLAQGALEELLEEALESRGVRVTRFREVKHLSARDGWVRVTTAPATEAPSFPSVAPAPAADESVWEKPAFVIGADGVSSSCRRSLGIEVVPLGRWRVYAMYDFHADLGGHEHEACVAVDPRGVAAYWPLGRDLARFTLELDSGFADAPSLDSLRHALRERAPWFAPRPEQLCWATVAEFDTSLVRRFGNGRVWLAGDAAHCAPPIGFESMNRGFYEAEVLSRLISTALHGEERNVGAFARFDTAQQAQWRSWLGREDADPASPREEAPFLLPSLEVLESSEVKARAAREHEPSTPHDPRVIRRRRASPGDAVAT